MKKFLALVLSVLLIASLSVTAFATDVDVDDNEGEVKVEIVDATTGQPIDPDKIYSVTIAWDRLTWTIKATKAEWDTDALVYNLTGGVLQDNTGTLKVTNHSNAQVNITTAFENSTTAKESTDAVSGLVAKINGTDGPIASAVGATTAPSLDYTITVEGSNPAKVKDMTYVVDTIVVTVKK